jgi:ABC-2 type transport system ATP-binding protein
VLEIVERLCSHIAIINKGHIVASGSLDELRAGVQSRQIASPDGQQTTDPNARLTLEQIFLNIVGAEAGDATAAAQELNWLG